MQRLMQHTVACSFLRHCSLARRKSAKKVKANVQSYYKIENADYYRNGALSDMSAIDWRIQEQNQSASTERKSIDTYPRTQCMKSTALKMIGECARTIAYCQQHTPAIASTVFCIRFGSELFRSLVVVSLLSLFIRNGC